MPEKVKSEDIKVCPLSPEDVTQDYVDWMNDPEIVQYTMQAGRTHSKEDVRAFVEEKKKSDKEFLFGIYYGTDHIGNIKLGPLNAQGTSADVSYIIGKKNFWGRGVAAQAVKKMCAYGFDELNLKRIEATIFAPNIASQKVLERNGFTHIHTKKDAYDFAGGKTDGLVFEIKRQD